MIYPSSYFFHKPGLFLEQEYPWTKSTNKIQLVFESGILKENNIEEIDSYKVGDKLSFEFSNFPDGLISKKSVNIKSRISDLRKDLVLVRIYSYDTNTKKEIMRIREFFGNMYDSDTLLTNPRYWNKE